MKEQGQQCHYPTSLSHLVRGRRRFQWRLFPSFKCLHRRSQRSNRRDLELPSSKNCLDEDTQKRLCAFYHKNRAATERVTEELNRRADAVAQMIDTSDIDLFLSEAEDDHGGIPKPSLVDTGGSWETYNGTSPLDNALSELGSTPSLDKNEEDSPLPDAPDTEGEDDGCHCYPLPTKNDARNETKQHGAPRSVRWKEVTQSLRRTTTECKARHDRPGESSDADWRLGAEALTGFASRQGSNVDVDTLVKSYDVFEPDMRSTRWNEFCRLVQQHRSDFDAYLRQIATVRGKHRAATVPVQQWEHSS